MLTQYNNKYNQYDLPVHQNEQTYLVVVAAVGQVVPEAVQALQYQKAVQHESEDVEDDVEVVPDVGGGVTLAQMQP